MNEVLKAFSQLEAWQIFREILERDRQKLVTVTSENDQTEETGTYRKCLEEAALETLEDTTVVLALPGKYRRRPRTTKRDPPSG